MFSCIVNIVHYDHIRRYTPNTIINYHVSIKLWCLIISQICMLKSNQKETVYNNCYNCYTSVSIAFSNDFCEGEMVNYLTFYSVSACYEKKEKKIFEIFSAAYTRLRTARKVSIFGSAVFFSHTRLDLCIYKFIGYTWVWPITIWWNQLKQLSTLCWLASLPQLYYVILEFQ